MLEIITATAVDGDSTSVSPNAGYPKNCFRFIQCFCASKNSVTGTKSVCVPFLSIVAYFLVSPLRLEIKGLLFPPAWVLRPQNLQYILVMCNRHKSLFMLLQLNMKMCFVLQSALKIPENGHPESITALQFCYEMAVFRYIFVTI
jgi:hypothetical protein